MEESVQFLGIRFTEEEIYELNKVINSEYCNLHRLSKNIMVSKWKKNKNNKTIYNFMLVFSFSSSRPYSVKIAEEDLDVQIELLNKDIKKSNFSNKDGIMRMIEAKISYPIYFNRLNMNGIKYDKDSYVKALKQKSEYDLLRYYRIPIGVIINLNEYKDDEYQCIGYVKEVNIEEQYAIINYNRNFKIDNIEDMCLSGNLIGRIYDKLVIIERISSFYLSFKEDSCWR